MNPLHARVVGAFNELGYLASFGSVATKLNIDVKTLYHLYPSREALGEEWFSSEVPDVPLDPGLHGAFTGFMLPTLRNLEDYRDFSRAWIAALRAMGLLHLPQLRTLRDSVADNYFIVWLDANHSNLSFPPNVRYEDVRVELADALVALALALINYWEADRSLMYAHTLKLVDAIGYLLDALLIRRADFGHAGLLVHLHCLYAQQQEQFIRPVLDILLKPERAGRFADPLSLLEVLRTFHPSPAQRT